MTIKVVQLGVGQQGNKNLEKLAHLRDKEKYPIDVIGIIDVDKKKLEGVKDIFPNAEIIVGKAHEVLSQFSDANLVFDSTNTPQHKYNIAEWAEVGKKGSVYAGEKPFILEPREIMYNSDIDQLPETETSQHVDTLTFREATPMVNAIESYMDTKRASLEFIKKNKLKLKGFYYFRGGSVIDKMKKTGRNILCDFGGAFDDKLPHDIIKLLQTIEISHGTENGELYHGMSASGNLYTLGLLKDGKLVYVTPDGKLTTKFSRVNNDSYADVNLDLYRNDVSISGKLVATHLGVPESHKSKLEEMLTPKIKEAIAGYASEKGVKLSPEDIHSSYGSPTGVEARMEELLFEDGSKIISQTFGNFFTVYVSPKGEPEVLQYGWTDGHLGYVRNAVEVAMGEAKPLAGASVIKGDADVSRYVGGVFSDYAKHTFEPESSLRGNYIEVLDLSKYPEIAGMFEPDLSRVIVG